MRNRNLATLIVAVILLVCTRTAARAEEIDATRFRKLVFFSVLEGLYEAGLPDEAVDRVLAADPKTGLPLSFLKGCPVCQPVYDAFKTYRARPAMWGLGRDFGPGASAAVVAALTNESDLERTAAIGDFVSEVMARKVATLSASWSAAEREAWNASFESAAREGERQLQLLQAKGGPAVYQMMWSCLVCDGARKGGAKKATPKP